MLPEFNDPNEVLATTRASSGRRAIGLTALGILGLFLIYVAFTSSPGLGGLALWMADKMRRATAGAIELTATELRDSDGTVIARVEDIIGLDRGVFAFKPSNGFLLRTKPGTGGDRIWRPGLWWRIGRRIGVGGMTPGSQTKFISEIISAMMAERP